MNPEAIARLRHGLRTPLNHLIGYAEMVRDEARDQVEHSETGPIGQALNAGRQMREQLQEALAVKAHIAGDALAAHRAAMAYWLQQVEKNLDDFDELSG